MNNEFKNQLEDEDAVAATQQSQAAQPVNPPDDEAGFWGTLFEKGFISDKDATKALPFIFFIAIWCMVYIGNRHMAETNLRQVAKLKREVNDLKTAYKIAKAKLAYKSTLTEVANRVDSMGLKQQMVPPGQIKLDNTDKDK